MIHYIENDKLILGVKFNINVLLKNVHFQYAVKLWNYLNSHMDAQNKAVKQNNEFEEKGLTKGLHEILKK
mgnify:CR=1 FL=1